MLPSVVDRGVVLHLGFRFPKDVLEWEGLDAGNLSFPLQSGGRHWELCPGDGPGLGTATCHQLAGPGVMLWAALAAVSQVQAHAHSRAHTHATLTLHTHRHATTLRGRACSHLR